LNVPVSGDNDFASILLQILDLVSQVTQELLAWI
jgi:hypothetical protein